jgi:hypothetical protein
VKSFKSLLESFAHQAASKLGLQYYGFGRYGRDNHVTHVSHADHLIPVRQKYSASKGEPVLLHYEHLEDQIFNRGADDGIHASDMRKAAMSDDYDTFKAGMNKNVPDALTRKIMQKIKDRLAK